MRTRFRRALAVCSAGAVAAVAVGGAVGLWPVGAPATAEVKTGRGVAETSRAVPAQRPLLEPVLSLVSVASREVAGLVEQGAGEQSSTAGPRSAGGADARENDQREPAPPRRSGQGRRVVFDMGDQRVWLVRDNGTVARTYLVSGSRHDNLSPGRYEVYSTSRHATSYTYAETMEYMVRFTRGENAAIGFHDIPVDPQGEAVQTAAQLGRPLSSGCIRQHPRDAKALWRFAPVGTRVVVTA